MYEVAEKDNSMDTDSGLDLLVVGFPCQPYTRQNVKRFTPGGVMEHAQRNATYAMLDTLRKFRPQAL